MSGFDLTLSRNGEQRVTRRLAKLATANVGVQAANRAALTAREYVVEKVLAELTLPEAYVRSLFSVRLATGEGYQTEARLIGRKRPVQLRRFDVRQEFTTSKRSKRIRGGVSVHVRKSEPRQLIKRAFFIPLRAGQIEGGNGFGVALRDGPWNSKPQAKRYPIRVLYGPRPADAMLRLGQPFTDALAAQVAEVTRAAVGKIVYDSWISAAEAGDA